MSLPDRDQALALLQEYTQKPGLIKHALAVEAALRAYAKKHGEDEHAWGMVGLLHDFDYERWPTPEDHPFRGSEILEQQGYPEWFRRAILSHATYSGVTRDSLLEKTLFACDERYGNCTDFHSLFIGEARSLGIPARFHMGIPVAMDASEGKVGGYHCWALFHVEEKGWVPVDISEADKHPEMKAYFFGNLTEDRVTFTTGRDINLVPRQDGEPLNFFVYPYVEVDGQVWPRQRVTLSFRYADAFQPLQDAYQTLCLDVITGDQTLFVHSDEVEASWRLFTPVIESEHRVHRYEAGEWGPTEAGRLLARQGHTWWLP